MEYSFRAIVDTTGSGCPRISCKDCGRAIIRQPFMNDARWKAAVEAFGPEHKECKLSSRNKFVEEKVEAWLAFARCRCAAHVLVARRAYEQEWEALENLETWAKTPEGKEALDQAEKAVKALDKARKEVGQHLHPEENQNERGKGEEGQG